MLKSLSYTLTFLLLIILFFPHNKVDKELRPYQIEVMKIVYKYCKPNQFNNGYKKTLVFSSIGDSIAGFCLPLATGYYITIDKDYWKTIKEDERFELITHEMAHCLIYKDHVDNYRNYMYPSLVPLKKKDVEEQFIRDLKDHCYEK